jgi:hypothetical protein
MISNEVLIGSLFCRRKAFFKQAGQCGEPHDFDRVQLQLDTSYKHLALDQFLSQRPGSAVLRDPPSLVTAMRCGAQFIVGATAEVGNIRSRLDLIERLDGS